jgi:hypothetical protein
MVGPVVIQPVLDGPSCQLESELPHPDLDRTEALDSDAYELRDLLLEAGDDVRLEPPFSASSRETSGSCFSSASASCSQSCQ